MIVQKIKDSLVKLGSENILVRLAVRAHARRLGFRATFENGVIALQRDGKKLLVNSRQLSLVPAMMEHHDGFFEWIETTNVGGVATLDFSRPAYHRYRQFGVGFYFPGIPEDYSLDSYTHWYRPRTGDTVFDVGAHAGMTSYFLARLVGPTGRVIAFEPDQINFEHLLRNVAHHGLTNVTPVQSAMAGSTGTAMFNMDGTMAAGLSEYLVYAKTGRQVAVPTVTFADACAEYGVPQFVKMDIEGAEVSLIQAALPFLQKHPVHLAFESYHRLRDGSRTWTALEELLKSISYKTASSPEFGEMFTWAQPVD